jgi:hypothetical protein
VPLTAGYGAEISAAMISSATARPAVRPTDRVTSVHNSENDPIVTGCIALFVVIAALHPVTQAATADRGHRGG